MEATADRYDGSYVLRISGRLKLVYDVAVRGHDIPSHCADCDCDGYLYGLAGVRKITNLLRKLALGLQWHAIQDRLF